MNILCLSDRTLTYNVNKVNQYSKNRTLCMQTDTLLESSDGYSLVMLTAGMSQSFAALPSIYSSNLVFTRWSM